MIKLQSKYLKYICLTQFLHLCVAGEKIIYSEMFFGIVTINQNYISLSITEKLQIDDNGLPERTKLSEELLKSATGRELRNFLQETTDECFQEMNEETDMDSCSYSTKLVTCLAERGRANCADWPAGGLPF